MKTKKTECDNCGKKLEPYEGKAYSQSRWAGRYYLGTDYYEFCKPCYKKWKKADNWGFKMLGIFVLLNIFIAFMIFFVCGHCLN